jgi:hypothetical protein
MWVGHRPVRSEKHTGYQLVAVLMDHVVVRGHPGIPQLQPRSREVAGGEQHDPRRPLEPGLGQLDPRHTAGFREHGDAVEAVHSEVPLGRLRQHLGIEQVTAHNYRC